jgi:hypothetical protein
LEYACSKGSRQKYASGAATSNCLQSVNTAKLDPAAFDPRTQHQVYDSNIFFVWSEMDSLVQDDNEHEALSAIPGEPFQLRGYQAEMVEESMRDNVIVVMDTGSGKTHMQVSLYRHRKNVLTGLQSHRTDTSGVGDMRTRQGTDTCR